MKQVSIRIKILNKEYPMRVNSEEVEVVKKAALILNQKTKEYRSKFGIDEPQDLLAMVAFDSIVSENKANSSLNSSDQDMNNELIKLEDILTSIKCLKS